MHKVIMLILVFAFMAGCKERPEGVFIIWVGSSGYHTNDFNINDGCVRFVNIWSPEKGEKIACGAFEISRN